MLLCEYLPALLAPSLKMFLNQRIQKQPILWLKVHNLLWLFVPQNDRIFIIFFKYLSHSNSIGKMGRDALQVVTSGCMLSYEEQKLFIEKILQKWQNNINIFNSK